MRVPEHDYTAFPCGLWNGREALLELDRVGKLLTVTVTADGSSASRMFTEVEAEELAGAVNRAYRHMRLSD